MLSLGSTAFKITRMFGLVTGYVPALCLHNIQVHCFPILVSGSKTTTAEQTLYSADAFLYAG